MRFSWSSASPAFLPCLFSLTRPIFPSVKIRETKCCLKSAIFKPTFSALTSLSWLGWSVDCHSCLVSFQNYHPHPHVCISSAFTNPPLIGSSNFVLESSFCSFLPYLCAFLSARKHTDLHPFVDISPPLVDLLSHKC